LGNIEATIITIISLSTPMVFAVLGETISEKVGVVNLSLEGSLLITALVGFAVSVISGYALIGFVAAGFVGGFVAASLSICDIKLKMNQIAVGFVLTIFLAKLSSYLGQQYVRVPGPYLPGIDVPILSDIPILGKILFGENIVVLLAIIAVPLTWYFLYKTRYGLDLRAVGENPYSADARGINVERTKFLYTTIGGILIGLGGAAFSLHAKFGWSDGHTTNYGWIALAIVIFGGWNPVRCVSGVYMFGLLQALAFKLQAVTLGLSQVLPLIPFPLMILTLVGIQIVNQRDVKWIPRFIKVMILGNQPQSLGVTFNKDG